MTARASTFIVSDSGEFIPVETCGIRFCRDRRIQGAIDLQVNDTPILGRSETDTIDALWSLILTYLEHFMAGEDRVLSFPERSFTLDLKRVSGGNVVVRYANQEEKRAALISEKEILKALTSGAIKFFDAALKSSPNDEWSYRRDFNTAVRLHEECSGPPPTSP
ncbi:hypothetical protein [Streptomyces sp. CB03238]|uniref:hypothetical protein n=1 Tax=Streptomyces sp. CB03238 TaxID=1907777 RepID=UPI00117C0B0F|nr:hypothetical protein [Streptomyces sp. CB03238]